MGETITPKHGMRIVNMVATSSLEHDVPLERMAAALTNTEYNPEQFPGLVIRFRQPKTSALVFSSGKLVITGAKSVDEIIETFELIKKALEKINLKVDTKPKIDMQNIVAHGSIKRDLNLNTLAIKLRNTEYEPEQFPGLVYKIDIRREAGRLQHQPTFLLFSNGKLVCTGTRGPDEVDTAIDILLEHIDRALSRK